MKLQTILSARGNRQTQLLSGILRALWPTRVKDERLNPVGLFEEYASQIKRLPAMGGDKGSALLDAVRKLSDTEASRRDGIDTRAGQLLAAAAISVSLVVSFFTQATIQGLAWYELLAYVLGLIYFARATIMALSVLGARQWQKVGPDELVEDYSVTGRFEMTLSERLLTQLVQNYKVNNTRASRLYAAQRCFRNALLALAIAMMLRLAV